MCITVKKKKLGSDTTYAKVTDLVGSYDYKQPLCLLETMIKSSTNHSFKKMEENADLSYYLCILKLLYTHTHKFKKDPFLRKGKSRMCSRES